MVACACAGRTRPASGPPSFAETQQTSKVIGHLGDLLGLLEENNVDVLVIKGPGISRLEASLQDRPFSDIDLLVAPSDFRRTFALLRAAGFREEDRTAQPREWCNRRCREAVNLKRPDGASVDLHHRLPPWLWTRALTFERLWRSREELKSANQVFAVPCASHQALIAHLHVVSDRGRPGKSVRVWRDIAITTAAAEPASLAAEARRFGLAGWSSWVLGQLPVEDRPAELLDRLAEAPPTVRSTWRLRLLSASSAQQMEVVAHLCRLPVLSSLLYGFALILPSRTFLRQRYDGPWALIRWLSSGIWRALGLTPAGRHAPLAGADL